MKTFDTPILFIIFNRLDDASQVFEEIRKLKPKKLYIAADGPRSNVPGEPERCRETRNIVSGVDWDCDVKTLFGEKNLGTKYGIISAIDWFFSHEEEGIILEHDCLPSQEFFYFCSTLLETYRHDRRIMHIGGTNLQFGQTRGSASYYFSRIASIWGWATWKRVWEQTDRKMSSFPQFEKEDQMINAFPDRRIANWITQMARRVYEEKIITFDYPHAFSILCNNGLCIIPNVNLVTNIGFGAKATHTKDEDHAHASLPIGSLGEIVHPSFFIPYTQADLYQLTLSVDNIHRGDIKKFTATFNKSKQLSY